MTPSTAKNTILVIEDDAVLRDAISAKLRLNGFDVITARSVGAVFSFEFLPEDETVLDPTTIEGVLERITELEHVSAVWLDHNLLGEEDGLDFIVKFKANGGTWSTIPIFVVSNSANPDLIKTYADLDIHQYYLKAEHRLEDIVNDIKSALTPLESTGN